MWIAGADGCRARWIVVLAGCRSADSLSLGETFDFESCCGSTTFFLCPKRRTIAVDIPIGLMNSAEPGGRPCDRLARAELGARASPVFSLPARPALEIFLGGSDYRAVCAANRAASTPVNTNRGSIGLAISKEAFFVLPELAEIDAVITLALQRRVKEAHPELAFMRANGGTALPPKKSPAGSRARKAILERLGPLPHVVSARQTTSALQRSRSAAVEVDFPRGVGRDDLYDAAISCEVAGRIVEKTPRCEAPSAIHAVCAWRSSPGGRLTWSTVELTACCT